MKRSGHNQRGFTLLAYGLVALALVIALSVALRKVYTAGEAAADARWQARELKINEDTARKLADATAAALAESRAIAKRYNESSAGYQAKLREKDHALDIALNAVRSGERRLSIPVTDSNALCGTAESGTSAAAGGRDGEARAKLSDAAAGFLIGEASRADKVVEQLTACQALVRTP